MRGYIFNNNEYNNLNALALGYIENFDLAIKDVKENYKKLLSFIKSCNKKIYKEAVDIFYSAKYVSNVTTIFIFMFLDEKKVYIKGKAHSFDEFVLEFEKAPEVYKNFIRDYGLEKTYCRMHQESSLVTNASEIRRNIEDEFVQDYLVNYFKYDGTENIKSYINMNDEHELFFRVNEVFKSNELQLILAHKYGLKSVLALRNDEYPIFKGLKLIKEFLSFEEVVRILSNTHYTWLLENLDKYKFNSKASDLKKELKKYTKLYSETKESFNSYKMIDFAHELSNKYLQFVECYEKKYISPKIVILKEEYAINIKYCDTYIPKAYMDKYVIEIVNENINKEIVLKEKKNNEIQPIDGKKERKRINKLSRYNKGLVFFNIIAIIYLLAVIVLSLTKILEFKLPLTDSTIDLVFIGSLVVTLMFTSSLSSRIERSRNAYNDVMRLRNLLDDELEIDDKEKEIERLKAKDKKNLRRVKTSRRITTALTCALLAFTYSVIAVNVFNTFLSDLLDQYFEWSKTYSTNSSAFNYVIYGPAIAFVYGLIRRKKGFFTNVLVIILGVAGVLVPVLL